MIFAFEIGFLPVTFWDLLDIAIVGYLIYFTYKTLRGSIAFNIFIGVATLFLVYWLLRLLKMEMVSGILNQVASLGIIGIIVIFQPEIRRFLLQIGTTALKGRTSIIGRWLAKSFDLSENRPTDYQQIRLAVLQMSREKMGALIVHPKSQELESVINTGIELDALVNQNLLISIFNKESPLHDGAVVIGKGRILAASCVLPLSESKSLPSTAGLRHRAALGLSERTDAVVLVVSEETGSISFARDSSMEFAITESRLNVILTRHFT